MGYEHSEGVQRQLETIFDVDSIDNYNRYWAFEKPPGSVTFKPSGETSRILAPWQNPPDFGNTSPGCSGPGPVPRSRALVPYGAYGTVLRATPHDAPNIRAFGPVAEAFQVTRGQRTFSPMYWDIVGDLVASGKGSDWFLHYSGAAVTGAMRVSSRSNHLEVVTLESVGGGGGTRLMKTAVQESINRGFGGQIQLHATDQALGFYYGLNPTSYSPIENTFTWDSWSAQRLLGD